VQDLPKYKGKRKQLAEELKTKGITDDRILKAIENIPRHFFLDNAFDVHAYEDKALPIDAGQTISQPFTVAFQTQLLQLKKGEKVLEIGTGSGYQTCVLLELGAKVFTIERQKALYDKTKVLLPKMGYNPKFYYGDGYKGLPLFAPFDKILVTAGATEIPQALLQQLTIGGILIIPVGDSSVQKMLSVTKVSETEFEKKEHGLFQFVPLLKDKEWKR
jgi:protein-L-isoaspartate(D-aspartate) O-methyltransferase